MARHIEAVMDGVQLSTVGPIIIQQVQEPAADMEITYGARPGRSGQDVLSVRRKALKVTIQTAIRELFDLGRRADVLQAMAGWARGSVLELSNHPGQVLNVICRSLPALGDVRSYTQLINIELEASEIPYWQEKAPVTASGSGASGSMQLYVPGTAEEIPVELTFTPGGTLTSLVVTVSCGGVSRSISLGGMSLSGAVKFQREAGDRLGIVSGSTRLLQYRSAESADDLLIPAGAATISWVANVSGTMAVSVRGRWL